MGGSSTQVLNGTGYGPYFGSGPDLQLGKGSISSNKSSFELPSAAEWLGVDYRKKQHRVIILGVWIPAFGGSASGYHTFGAQLDHAWVPNVSWTEKVRMSTITKLATMRCRDRMEA